MRELAGMTNTLISRIPGLVDFQSYMANQIPTSTQSRV